MISNTHIQTIKYLANLLQTNNIWWKLIGSSNLALQGVNVSARDIDICTKEEDIYKVDELLKGYCVETVHSKESPELKSLQGLYKINDIQVEILADSEAIQNGVWVRATERYATPVMIKLDEVEVPCPSLKEEFDAYTKYGRTEKASLIKEAMDKNQSK